MLTLKWKVQYETLVRQYEIRSQQKASHRGQASNQLRKASWTGWVIEISRVSSINEKEKEKMFWGSMWYRPTSVRHAAPQRASYWYKGHHRVESLVPHWNHWPLWLGTSSRKLAQRQPSYSGQMQKYQLVQTHFYSCRIAVGSLKREEKLTMGAESTIIMERGKTGHNAYV